MLRAVVFDLDDTLYPERAYVTSGFRAVAAWAERRLSVPADRCFQRLEQLFESDPRGKTFDGWLSEGGFDPGDLVPEMVRVYRGHAPDIAPYAEVPSLLRRLRRRYVFGLVTDGDPTIQRRKLSALGLASWFDLAVFTGELEPGAGKPSPRAFRTVLGGLGLTGEEAVYIADNPTKDFIGAREVGMSTVRVRAPAGLYSHLEPPTPQHASDREIQELEAVPGTLDEIELDVASRARHVPLHPHPRSAPSR
ncbi:MAG: HAD family hydrolase [Actinomycetota bacterium]